MKADIKGKQFGRLLAIKPTDQKDKSLSIIWECICDCGKTVFLPVRHLTSKTGTRSCGCLQKERAKANLINQHKSGIASPAFKHGQYKSRLYNIWRNMKARCYNPSASRYRLYGGRDIKVCVAWKEDFITFYDWAMASGYRDDLTIDRIDNDGDYEPGNCRWASNTVQQNNRGNCKFISYEGKTQTLREWANELNINYKTLQKRLQTWDVDKAFSCPVNSPVNSADLE